MDANEIKKANRKALPKFMLIMFISLLVGGSVGFCAAKYGLDALADGMKSAGAFFGTHIAPYQSVIFCGQFNTCLSVSLPAPNFRFCPSNLSYPFPALWAILRYSRVRNVFNAAYCTIFRL